MTCQHQHQHRALWISTMTTASRDTTITTTPMTAALSMRSVNVMRPPLLVNLILLLFVIFVTAAGHEINLATKSSLLASTLPATCSRLTAAQRTALANQLPDINHMGVVSPIPPAITRRTPLSELNAGEIHRHSFVMEETSPLTIKLSDCLDWKVFYNETINLTGFFHKNETRWWLSCAPSGHYDVVLSTHSRHTITPCVYQLAVSASHFHHDWAFLNRTNKGRVRVVARAGRRHQVTVRWDKSRLDIHAIKYCVAIGRDRPQRTLCEALASANTVDGSSSEKLCPGLGIVTAMDAPPSRILRFPASASRRSDVVVTCTGTRPQQILRGFQPHAIYFVDVFAVHPDLANLTFLLAASRIALNRTAPVNLIEGVAATGRLTDTGNGGSLAFSYRVPKKNVLRDNSIPGHFRVYVIPCGGGAVDVRVTRQRKKVQTIQSVHKPATFSVQNVQAGERYLIRISVSGVDDIGRVGRVEIIATTGDQPPQLAQLPTNSTVTEVHGARSCRSVTIAWQASRDPRRLRYCVTVIKVPRQRRNDEDVLYGAATLPASGHRMPSYCGLDAKLAQHPHFQQMHCFCPDSRPEMESLQLSGLTAGSYYLAYVTVSLVNGRSLPYEVLRIKTDRHCRPSSIIN